MLMNTITIKFGVDGGDGHVYRDTPLLTVVNGTVVRECVGLEWEDRSEPFKSWEPPSYGEPWATVNGKIVPVDEAIRLARAV